MQLERYILCGGATCEEHTFNPEQDIRLRLWGDKGPDRVTLRIEDIHQKMYRSVPAEFQDLLEIATYVYSADQVVPRGADDVDAFGDAWRRDLCFVIPVRRPEFWRRPEVMDALCATLGFLSDDRYRFDFRKLDQQPPFQDYLNFADDGHFLGYPEQVVMFSGGLDSLAGAIEEVLNQKHKVVLVTHKSTQKLNARHRALERMLADKAGENAPFHISVRVHKNKSLNHEYTQRSRSFLYMSIGVTIAKMLGLKSVRFYENGVISLNLPVCAQVVGGRATRTTHPRVMQGFQEIASLVAGESFVIENPFIWKTKAEVVEVIMKAGCQDMVAASTTCTHTWEMSNQHTHCGTCSQCIDRRFAVIAAKADEFDPVAAYKFDIFTQSRDKGEDKIMMAAYLERANQVDRIADVNQFIGRYSEVSRVLRYLDSNAARAAQKVFELYKRHAREVIEALDKMVARNVTAIRQRTLPGDCLLRVVYESGSVNSVPAVTVTVKQHDNFFRRRGDAWEARFQSRNPLTLLNVNKGCSYLQVLLAHPREELSIFAVVCGSAIDDADAVLKGIPGDDSFEEGFSVTQGPPLGDAGVVADHTAILQYKDRALALLREIDEARDAGDVELVAELEDEAAQVAQALTSATGKGGRLRKAKDTRKNVLDAFRNAVNRAIKAIGKYDKVFAEHLSASIRFGFDATYQPSVDITWEVRPPVD